jgi:hypothetical protein
VKIKHSQTDLEQEQEFDAKECVLSWAERGELPLSRPLKEQMRSALEGLGFQNIGIEHEPARDVWMIRADVGENTNCPNPRMARCHLLRMARRVGMRITRCVDYLVVQDGTLRAGVTFVNPLRL